MYVIENKPVIWKSEDGGNTFAEFATLGGTLEESYADGERYSKMIEYDNKFIIINPDGINAISKNGQMVNYIPAKNKSGDFVLENDNLTIYMILNEGTMPSGFTRNFAKTADLGATWTPLSDTFKNTLKFEYGAHMGKSVSELSNYNSFIINWTDMGIYDNNTFYVGFDTNSSLMGGVAMTADGGATWYWALNNMQVGTQRAGENWISPNGKLPNPGPIDGKPVSDESSELNLGYSGSPVSIVVDRSNPRRALFTNTIDAYLTEDGGKTWYSLASDHNEDSAYENWAFKTSGLDSAKPEDFAVNPYDKNHLIMCYTDMGVFQSYDGGKYWQRVNRSVYDNGMAVAFDPFNKGAVLVATGEKQNAHNNDKEAAEAYIMSSEGTGGDWAVSISRSEDGGKTWVSSRSDYDAAVVYDASLVPHTSVYNHGLPWTGVITGIVFDPNHKGIVYASVNGGGIYKSTDGGVNWTRFNEGLAEYSFEYNMDIHTGIPIHRLTLSDDGKTLYALYSQREFDETVYGESENPYKSAGIAARVGGLYKLNIGKNAGEWEAVSIPNGNMLGTTIHQLSVDKNGVMYAVTEMQLKSLQRISDAGGYDIGLGGAYVSKDGGATWTQIWNDTDKARGIMVDSQELDYIYMTTYTGQILMSDKGVNTTAGDWTEIAGYEFEKGGYIYAAEKAGYFYVGTFGGGMWKIPVPNYFRTKLWQYVLFAVAMGVTLITVTYLVYQAAKAIRSKRLKTAVPDARQEQEFSSEHRNAVIKSPVKNEKSADIPNKSGTKKRLQK
jgi:photosystem II stability/assembly factor-like uncharacterized protein